MQAKPDAAVGPLQIIVACHATQAGTLAGVSALQTHVGALTARKLVVLLVLQTMQRFVIAVMMVSIRTAIRVRSALRSQGALQVKPGATLHLINIA